MANGGYGDRLTFVQKSSYDSSFENGADATKVPSESGLNVYVGAPEGNLSRVATDNLEGTQITIETGNDTHYTLSLSHVNGTDYALRDKVTGHIVTLSNGENYTFTQAPNTTVEGRFEIVALDMIATSIDNTTVNTGAKGIYTILGQYVGEDFEVLPAGIYVIDGVKVVK